VRREAGARGAGIEHTRLKGLVPHQTLLDALGLDLQLKDFYEDQILEERLAQACLQQTRSHEQLTQPSLLDRLASSASTPAGGSAAAYTAAAAAAVVVKIARLTLARKQYQDVHPQMDAAIERAESWRAELARYVELDAQAYNEIIRAKRLPRAEPAQAAARSAAIEKAVFGAAAAPLECAWISEHVIKEALNMAAVANISMIADAFSAAALANAAITIFANNVSVNLAAYREREDAAQMIRDAMEIQTRAEQYLHQVQTLLISRREG